MIKRVQVLLSSHWFRWLCVSQFFLAIAIFTYLALMPFPQLPAHTTDKELHFIGNLLLMLSAYVATAGRFKVGLIILVLLPYSAAVEFSQYFTKTRQVDMHDLLANFLGLLSGFVIALIINWVWSKLSKDGST